MTPAAANSLSSVINEVGETPDFRELWLPSHDEDGAEESTDSPVRSSVIGPHLLALRRVFARPR